MVVVVDDDQLSLDLMTAVFERFGLPLITISNSSEALDVISDVGDKMGLALLDLSMPRLNGFELCGALRSDARFAKLPIVALTANATAETVANALAAGFNKALFKPFRVQEIHDLVDEFGLTRE